MPATPTLTETTIEELCHLFGPKIDDHLRIAQRTGLRNFVIKAKTRSLNSDECDALAAALSRWIIQRPRTRLEVEPDLDEVPADGEPVLDSYGYTTLVIVTID